MPDFGDGSPRENYGQVDPNAPSVANGQISAEQWAEYQKKRRRDAIMGIIGTLGATTGLGALGAVGGAGAAASPEFGVGAANTGIWGGAGMTPGSIATGVGASGGAAAGGGAAAAGGLGSAGAAKGLLSGMSARDWAALVASGIGTAGGLMSNKPITAPSSATTDPNMQKLIASMQGRLDQSEPLYKSIMAMANGLLPTQYQNGGAGR